MSTITVSASNIVLAKNKSLKDFVASSNMPQGIGANESISTAKIAKMFPIDGFDAIHGYIGTAQRFSELPIETLVDLAQELNAQSEATAQLFTVKTIEKATKPTWSEELRESNGGSLSGIAPDGQIDAVKFSLIEKATNTPLDVLISNKAENNALLSQFTVNDVVKIKYLTGNPNAKNVINALWVRPTIE